MIEMLFFVFALLSFHKRRFAFDVCTSGVSTGQSMEIRIQRYRTFLKIRIVLVANVELVASGGCLSIMIFGVLRLRFNLFLFRNVFAVVSIFRNS